MSRLIVLLAFFSVHVLGINSINAQSQNHSRIEEVKENIISSLSSNLKSSSQPQPLLIIIGGYVCSGKTTLSNSIKENYGMTIFSLNAIRQAMLDEGIDIRNNKQEERVILFDVYPKLLGPCIANLQNIVIDANANRQGIQEALKFLQMNPGGNRYRVIKIHLKASEKELERRVHARIQHVGIHQGTKDDLDHELNTPAKAIYPDDYDLVIDTENTSFEDEMLIVHGFLQPYFENR
jgi:cytidylate kinase